MPKILVFHLVLLLARLVSGDLSLKIIKSTDDYYTPVTSSTVEEKAGSNFSLLCDLVSSETHSDYYDFQITWFKNSSNDLRFWRENVFDNGRGRMYTVLSPSEMNKAVRRFHPLRRDDAGKYICVSLKYNLIAAVNVVVVDVELPHGPSAAPVAAPAPPQHCNDQMFRCGGNICIFGHYMCDGKRDCSNGRDESADVCDGDPCRDKLPCDDGRCIPHGWCCDRQIDPNCSVVVRPKCCQAISDAYEDSDHASSDPQSATGGQFIYIAMCVLVFSFFVFVFFIGLVKLAMDNRKLQVECGYDLPRSGGHVINLTTRRPPPVTDNFDIDIDDVDGGGCNNRDSLSPLILPLPGSGDGGGDQPPPYLAVVRGDGCLNEPPPPYTSREALNV